MANGGNRRGRRHGAGNDCRPEHSLSPINLVRNSHGRAVISKVADERVKRGLTLMALHENEKLGSDSIYFDPAVRQYRLHATVS